MLMCDFKITTVVRIIVASEYAMETGEKLVCVRKHGAIIYKGCEAIDYMIGRQGKAVIKDVNSGMDILILLCLMVRG